MQHCPIPLSLLGSLSFAALLSASPCQAQPDQPLELGGTEVTASHVQGDSVEAEQLQHYQAADLQDVFESSPEASVGGGARRRAEALPPRLRGHPVEYLD